MVSINRERFGLLREGRLTKKRARAGYTLLELLLALGLSVVVFAAVGSGIQIYLVALTKQQARG